MTHLVDDGALLSIHIIIIIARKYGVLVIDMGVLACFVSNFGLEYGVFSEGSILLLQPWATLKLRIYLSFLMLSTIMELQTEYMGVAIYMYNVKRIVLCIFISSLFI